MKRSVSLFLLVICVIGLSPTNLLFAFNPLAPSSLLTKGRVVNNDLILASIEQFEPTTDSPNQQEFHSTVTIPFASIFDQITASSFSAYLNHLSNVIGSRLFGSEGNDEAAEYIAQQFENMGLEVSYHEFGDSGHNVVGKLPSGSIHNNQCIVVGAHYDTIPASSKGADDNGSGVAAVLEIARVLSHYQFNYTIYFVAFDEEEIGLYGSRAFSDYLHSNDIPVAFVFNFDMIIWDNPSAPPDTKYEIIHNGGDSEVIATHIVNIGTGYGLPVAALDAPGMWMSDHSSFWDHGDPAVWFFEYGGLGNPYIHSSADNLAQPDYSMELGTVVTKNAATALADMATIVSTEPGFPHAAFVAPTPTGYVTPDDDIPIVLEIIDTDLDVNKVELSINNAPYIDITSGLNTTHCTYSWDGTGFYGLTSFDVRVFDATGWQTSSRHTFRVDKGLDCQITAPYQGEQITQGTQYTIWIDATDLDGPKPIYVRVRINESEWHYASAHIVNQRYYYNWTVTGTGLQTIQIHASDTNGYQNTSQVEVEVLVYLPTIKEVTYWPTQPYENSLVQVSAQVTPHPLGADIYNVQVIYSIDNNTWKNRRLLPIENNLYQYHIGPFPIGSQIRFYIEAVDINDNTIIFPTESEYYSFTVVGNPTPILMISGVAIMTILIAIGVIVVWRRQRT
ncbi:MAG: M28 family metallopeptidase [Promethearchaeota archaeon]